MRDTKRGKHERRRRGLMDLFQTGREAAARRLRHLPSIVTRERMLIGKDRA